jgi:hypothetical protein
MLKEYSVTYRCIMPEGTSETIKSLMENKDMYRKIIASSKDIVLDIFNNIGIKENIKTIVKSIEYIDYPSSELQAWARENEPDDKMLWKNGYWDQIVFIRDDIVHVLARTNPMDYEKWHYRSEEIRNSLQVINTHRSKSIKLPVYQINYKGFTFILRNNFYDWKISVIGTKIVTCNFKGLFEDDNIINPIYCQGFPEEYVFGSYKDNNGKFTIEINGRYNLYTFMFLLKHWIDENMS